MPWPTLPPPEEGEPARHPMSRMEERRRRAQGLPMDDPLGAPPFGSPAAGESSDPRGAGAPFGRGPGEESTTNPDLHAAPRPGANTGPHPSAGPAATPFGTSALQGNTGPIGPSGPQGNAGALGSAGLPGGGGAGSGTGGFGASPAGPGRGSGFQGDPLFSKDFRFGDTPSASGTGHGQPGPGDQSAPGPGAGPLPADPLSSNPLPPNPLSSNPSPPSPLSSNASSSSDPLTGSQNGFGGGRAPGSPRERGGVFAEPDGPTPFNQPFERVFGKPDSRPYESPQTPVSASPPGPTSAFEPPRAPSRPFESAQSQPESFGGGRAPNRPFEASPDRPAGSPETPGAEERPFEAFAPQSPGLLSRPRKDGRPSEGEPPPPPMETRRSEPEPDDRRSRAPLIVGGGLVGLIGVVVAGVMFLNSLDDPPTTAAVPNTRPTAQAPIVTSNNDKYGFAASRKTDPQPLTLKEVFGHKTVTAHGRSYLMTVRRTDKKCGDAVHGTGIQKALKAGGCTQFLRASFRDKRGDLIGTVGVGNLKTAAAAKKAGKTGTGKELADYVTPLPGKDTATKLLGGPGESFAAAWPQGHYLVMLWFQYKDGHKPSKNEMKQLNRAALDITEATVFAALDTRALTGAKTN
ncbi:hypothetical protein [Sphaerisporangium krabiense]|uniref:Uncharacterized protein n=1 Tax=Sphaerisporangium krabiense TaxID=763782 RepID=A0A7W8YZW6_9ACTN|nr:hypothetical protein [Sphaerisporangium krabiense]MBB5624903.1 hypothetical protein [Sphaerisporangium krabiense]